MTADAWLVTSNAARELSVAADALSVACRENFARVERGEPAKPTNAAMLLRAWQALAISYAATRKVSGCLGVASAAEPVAPIDTGTSGLGGSKG